MPDSDPTARAGDAAAPCEATGRRFVRAWCCAVIFAALVLFPLLTAFLINWFDEAGLRWIKEIRTRKFRMAETAHPKGRILVAGGSSGLFGVDAELLEKRLQRPVVNLASHAGLGLRFLLEDARHAGRAGDTILLNIEYGLYASEPLLTDTERRYIWTYEPARLFKLPLGMLSKQLYGVPFTDYARSWDLWNRRFAGTLQRSEPTLWTEYTFVLLSSHGDFRGDVHPTAPVAEANLPGVGKITPTSAQLLEDFFSWAKKRDIHVIGLFPAVMQASGAPDSVAPIFEKIRHFYQDHQLTVIGDPKIVQMPRELFLDTPSHTNAVGRRLHTESLARELQVQFHQPSPPANPAVFLLRDTHGAVGPNDPSAEFTDCRFLAADPLPHPFCITPAQVRDLIQKGTTVYYDDPSISELLPNAGLQSQTEPKSTSTLADWVKKYPRHLFLLSLTGSGKVPNASAALPGPFADFLNDEAPVRAAILGTGSFARIKKTQHGSELIKVVQKTTPRWSHALPVEYSAAAWPSSETHPDLRPLMVQRQSIVEETPAGDLAVCVADPDLGIVIQRGNFHDGLHLDSELRRVTAQ